MVGPHCLNGLFCGEGRAGDASGMEARGTMTDDSARLTDFLCRCCHATRHAPFHALHCKLADSGVTATWHAAFMGYCIHHAQSIMLGLTSKGDSDDSSEPQIVGPSEMHGSCSAKPAYTLYDVAHHLTKNNLPDSRFIWGRCDMILLNCLLSGGSSLCTSEVRFKTQRELVAGRL